VIISPAIDLDRLLKLRLVVARFGEMDLAKWWRRVSAGEHGACVSAYTPWMPIDLEVLLTESFDNPLYVQPEVLGTSGL